MLSGEVPFHTGHIEGQIRRKKPEKIPGISAEMNDLVLRLLSKEPEDRYRSAREVREVLDGTEARRREAVRHREAEEKKKQEGEEKRREERRKLINDFGIEFVQIEPGSFLMGSPSNEAGRDSDETQHRVTLSRGFELGSMR